MNVRFIGIAAVAALVLTYPAARGTHAAQQAPAGPAGTRCLSRAARAATSGMSTATATLTTSCPGGR